MVSGRPNPESSPSPEPTFDDLDEQVLVSLRRIIRAIDLHSRLLVQRHGITGPQIAILRKLADRQSLSAGEIAQSVSLSKGTVSGILDRLERRGLVTRHRSKEDRRRVLVTATEKTIQLLEAAPLPLQDQFLDRFNRLESWERMLLVSSLQRLVAMMEADRIDAGPILPTGSIVADEQKVRDYLGFIPVDPLPDQQ